MRIKTETTILPRPRLHFISRLVYTQILSTTIKEL